MLQGLHSQPCRARSRPWEQWTSQSEKRSGTQNFKVVDQSAQVAGGKLSPLTRVDADGVWCALMKVARETEPAIREYATK